MSYADHDDVTTWGVSEDVVWDQAFANFFASDCEAEIDEQREAMTLFGPDGYSASIILHPPPSFSGGWGSDVVVVPATRDQVFLFRMTDRSKLRANLSAALSIYLQDPRQLSPLPYRHGPNGVEEWVPDPRDVCADMVSQARSALVERESAAADGS